MADHTDLAYLERFCKGDKARMEKYVRMYLEGTPPMFRNLATLCSGDDAEALAVAAHSLRPQVNYMGAQRLFDLLNVIELKAREQGTAACSVDVNEAIALSEKVMAELRGQPGHA